MARKPRSGSRAPKKSTVVTADYARQVIKDLKYHAEQGHPWATDSVLKWLGKFPEVKSEFRQLDSLVAKAEAAWVRAVAFGDPLAEQTTRDEVAAMKTALLGVAPSVLDTMLASALVVARLSHNRAAILAARTADHPTVRAARERVLSVSQKRLVAATKAWLLLAGKKAREMTPKGTLKIFAPAAAGSGPVGVGLG
jgi:hypothetical protein